MINVLLQTTIERPVDDWGIARFAMLRDYLGGLRGDDGAPLFRVTARDREAVGRPDPVLSTLDASDYDQLWLFAVDVGDGLAPEDCQAISRFRRRGGGLMVTRDHMDVGTSLCTLADVGAAHHFHTRNQDPDASRHCCDDPFTSYISWPNYHSGANGDYQTVRVVGEPHPVLRDAHSPDGLIRFLPAHPHEGSVGAPADDASARVILQGRSAATGQHYNLAVAFEAGEAGGPAIAQSTFHHFCDYNWDVGAGAPSFVSEAPGRGIEEYPEALRSTQQYVRNVALWLAGRLDDPR